MKVYKCLNMQLRVLFGMYFTFPIFYTITISKSKLRESKKQLLLESVTAPSASELASANSEKRKNRQSTARQKILLLENYKKSTITL